MLDFLSHDLQHQQADRRLLAFDNHFRLYDQYIVLQGCVDCVQKFY